MNDQELINKMFEVLSELSTRILAAPVPDQSFQWEKSHTAMEEAILRAQSAAEGGPVKNRPIRQN